MQDEDAIVRNWLDWRKGAPLDPVMRFADEGLVLGRGTLVAAFAALEPAAGDPIEGNERRIAALLTATFARPIEGDVVETMRRACALWRAGDKGLAQLYLALTGLPRIGDWSAYCLHLAEKSLRGVSPCELLARLGFEEAARGLEQRYGRRPA